MQRNQVSKLVVQGAENDSGIRHIAEGLMNQVHDDVSPKFLGLRTIWNLAGCLPSFAAARLHLGLHTIHNMLQVRCGHIHLLHVGVNYDQINIQI